MDRITERQLYLPALYIINQEPNITTSKLIKKLVMIMKPTGEDVQILNNRNDTKFSQKVRNLVSHHNLDQYNLGYTNYDSSKGHIITQKGKYFLTKNIDAIEYLFDNDFNYNDLKSSLDIITDETEHSKKILTYDENEIISEGKMRNIITRKYERSSKLRSIACEHYSKNGLIICSACKFDFYSFYGEIGKGYIEMHHIKPIFKYEGQTEKAFILQALKNITPVCANCHRIIHRNKKSLVSIEELRNVIKTQKSLYR